MHSEDKPHPSAPHRAAWRPGGVNRRSPAPAELVQTSSASSHPKFSWILSLWVPASLETSGNLPSFTWDIKSSPFWESTWWLCPNQLYKYSSACKWMALTVEKAKSSWKCKMALTQPQMLWLAGIEVGKSLI